MTGGMRNIHDPAFASERDALTVTPWGATPLNLWLARDADRAARALWGAWAPAPWHGATAPPWYLTGVRSVRGYLGHRLTWSFPRFRWFDDDRTLRDGSLFRERAALALALLTTPEHRVRGVHDGW